TNYVYLALACGVVASIMGAYGVISLYFPLQYQCLLAYVPVFFVALIFFEVSRIFGAGFGLCATTAMMPVWAAVALGMQAGLLLMLQVFGLWGILCANLCAFAMHGMIRHWYGSKLYTPAIVDVPFITRTTVLMLWYSAVFHMLCWYGFSWPAFLVFGMTWPVAVWLFLLQEKEKEWCGTQLIHGMAWLTRRIVPQSSAPRGADTILYLRTDLCSQEIKVGGSVAHTLGVLNGFKACGYEIVCASAAMPSLLRQQNVKAFYHLQVPPYLFFMRWKLGHLRWRLESCMASIVFAWQLRKVVRSTTYAYIYQRYSLLNCLGVLLSKALKTPLILEYNGSEVWAFEQWGDKKAWGKLTWLARAVERYNVTHADYIVVVSDVLRDELVARGIDAHKILVNPNGVDVQVYNPAVLEQARQELRSKQTIEEKFVVGFVGTFSYWHGIEVLASVIPAVVALQPQVHFLLIGDGPLKNYLLQELERHNVLDHVICTGFVPQYEAKNYLACCDAFISPTQPNTDGSRFFGSPTKLFEYVSMGKPVIVSDLEQLAEIVKPALSLYNQEPVTEQFGIVVQPDDIQGFVQAIVRLSLMDSDDRVRMGNNARNRAVEQFSWDNHVQKIHTFVQKK
ncbi:MAG TPA: glycosyltransferase family 4 protein, partial [Candidatus Limnocylindria bacterium]|nr:glycosyltransferase family 4 protein [Candidatus Limnocylindria bacterium]